MTILLTFVTALLVTFSANASDNVSKKPAVSKDSKDGRSFVLSKPKGYKCIMCKNEQRPK